MSAVMQTQWTTIDSPFGRLTLVANDEALLQIRFPHEVVRTDALPVGASRCSVFDIAERQLAEYFSGRRRAFELPLAARGTGFQRAVWSALVAIPPGETISYAELSRRVTGSTRASRAVGAANGKNPLPIVVPCHRVIGSDGSLTGFAGGLDLKRQLLEHERLAFAASSRSGRRRGFDRRPLGHAPVERAS
jgi:methylated-DNA-[protein]-cysteine S-methyltransferase